LPLRDERVTVAATGIRIALRDVYRAERLAAELGG